MHATVVLAERPTSAKPGDEAIVFADGTIEGFVEGPARSRRCARRASRCSTPGSRCCCGSAPTPEPEQETPRADRLTVHNPCLSGGTLEIFLEPVVPAPLLVVHGESPIAAALASLGERLGYQVRAGAGADPTEAAAVVCASHGRDEEEVLEKALRSGVAYVGLVASRKRGEAVVGSLDVDEVARARVHTPAGLDIGARTAEEVALSILAEIVAERRRTSGRPVEERAAETPETAEQTGTATDPVCGMTVATVETSLHLDHDGVRYWFCGTGCLRAFAADPGGYLAS